MTTWGRYFIAFAFFMHGAGMLGMGLTLPAALASKDKPLGHSWLLSRFGGEAVVGTVLWGLAGIGYLVAAVGFALGADWWTLGAWLGAPATIVAIALWFGSVPLGTYVGGVLAALTVGALVFLSR